MQLPNLTLNLARVVSYRFVGNIGQVPHLIPVRIRTVVHMQFWPS